MFVAMRELKVAVTADRESLAGEVRVAFRKGFIWLPQMPLAAAVKRFKNRPRSAAMLTVSVEAYE
jgi:hypothetical protein